MSILDVLGNQNADDLSFITDNSALEYHTSLGYSKSTSKLRSIFSHTSDGLFDLLEGLLTYNPSLRLTAKECLRSPIFDSIRVKDYE